MVVVLSPHSDDAAFSIAGALKRLADLGVAVRVVTCFSRSCYMPRREVRCADAVTRVRKAEDEAFHGLLARCAEPEWIDLPDAHLRGERLDRLLTARPFTSGERALGHAIADRVSARLGRRTILWLPLAIGAHIDHRVVRSAGVAAARRAGARRLCFYEDLPYAGGYSRRSLDAMIGTFARDLGTTLRPRGVAFPGLLAFKRDAARCYPSQLSDTWLHAIERHAIGLGGPNGAERIWIARMRE